MTLSLKTPLNQYERENGRDYGFVAVQHNDAREARKQTHLQLAALRVLRNRGSVYLVRNGQAVRI